MTKIYSWKIYNHNIQKLINQNINFNNSAKFNAVDNSYYSQTRDIFALVANTSKVINILDFGSNLSLISNLNNKIDTKAKKFIVYDPFYSLKDDIKIKNINYKIFSNFTDIIKIKFDFKYLLKKIWIVISIYILLHFNPDYYITLNLISIIISFLILYSIIDTYNKNSSEI